MAKVKEDPCFLFHPELFLKLPVKTVHWDHFFYAPVNYNNQVLLLGQTNTAIEETTCRYQHPEKQIFPPILNFAK